MRLFVTILEDSQEAALDAIAAIGEDHDGIEVRAEQFPSLDVAGIRAATRKPVILTIRGRPWRGVIARSALAAGIDLLDVEYTPGVFIENPQRTVLSFHDFEGMPAVETLAEEMRARGCRHVKIAVTPRTFEENRRLLKIAGPGVTVIGMGERGLYSRILAPFLQSELLFVAPSEERSAAPGQITLRRALEIYGERRDAISADRVFAVVGNPAGHSLSPPIHNALFREKGVAAAYTIASIETFDEIQKPFLDGDPCGLSITAPFKEQALAFAESISADIGENAREAGAVNTLVRLRDRIIADNTDVDGFNAILAQLCGRDRKSVALVGAGGTARAALVALDRAGMHTTVFNRTEENARRLGVRSAPLEDLRSFDGEIVINTTSTHAIDFPARAGMAYIAAAYGDPAADARHQQLRDAGVQVFEGLDLLRGQAVRQHQLFMKVFE